MAHGNGRRFLTSVAAAFSFQHFVEQSKRAHARALLNKAYFANRLAKLNRCGSRLACYRLKAQYLSAAIEVYPDTFWVASRAQTRISTILSVRSTLGTSLHVPEASLSIRAQAYLAGKQTSDPSARPSFVTGEGRAEETR